MRRVNRIVIPVRITGIDHCERAPPMTKLLTAIAALTLAWTAHAGESHTAASASAADAATLVVYRADADLRSRRLSFDVHLDQQDLGRIRRDTTLVIQQPPGAYTLNTSLPGENALPLTLQPGATYYVEASLSVRGSELQVTLQEVGEQVARTRARLPDGQI